MKTVTFGEIMLRLSPPAHARFLQTGQFDIVAGGGEANVAVSLANCGLDAEFVTDLPDQELGQILTGISISICKAIKEIPGFAAGTFDRDAAFRALVEK